MTEYEWTPWVFDTLPEVGDYVQIEFCHHDNPAVKGKYEGFVTRKETTPRGKPYLILPGLEGGPWVKERWRKRIVPNRVQELRKIRRTIDELKNA